MSKQQQQQDIQHSINHSSTQNTSKTSKTSAAKHSLDLHSQDSYQPLSSIQSTNQDYFHRTYQKTHSSTQLEKDTRITD
ncbi:hypothetical protein KEM48_013407 [Puccinia striiformis f. sp. tritici PST-130]|nr:hypothetical protein KEM48_013407 [Puccinia striiformis f. sp. tritici PST-130]